MLFSYPLNETDIHIHLVEVDVTYKGEEPEPDMYPPSYEEYDDPWFKRSYCYLVVDYSDPDLSTTVRSWVEEDNDEGCEVLFVDIDDIQTDHITDYPTKCNMMSPGDVGSIWNNEFIRRWGEDDVFVKDGRLYSTDRDHVLFPLYLSNDMTVEEMIQESVEEGYDLQIHQDT